MLCGFAKTSCLSLYFGFLSNLPRHVKILAKIRRKNYCPKITNSSMYIELLKKLPLVRVLLVCLFSVLDSFAKHANPYTLVFPQISKSNKNISITKKQKLFTRRLRITCKG